ncbi:MAG TPA: DUF882 domain-containing protein [Roseiarcus sp.]|nr:DUF882 domain-containing protein [Roseiarcus sp.]
MAVFSVLTSDRRVGASRAALATVVMAGWVAPNSTESAVANGDTRTVTFANQHTNEEGSFTYMVNGVYDQAVLDKLNWFMRDWRLNESTKMDPRLFDIIWEVYRESGSQQPIDVFSAYRSPQTNAMLRRRSRGVAEHSQHMEGKAIDAHFEDVGPARIRDVAMRMQEGGVGFYPQGLTWVHIDSGAVRYWPRMSREALTRLFPDGKTVFIPSDGQPMPGYDLAKAEIEQRGGQIQTASGGGLFAWLFGARGGGADDAEEAGGGEAIVAASHSGRGGGRTGGSSATVEIADVGPVPSASEPIKAPQPAAAPEPAAKPQVVAALEEPKVANDAEADPAAKLAGLGAALDLAPLPPPRPANLLQQVALLADIPLPPVRPGDLSASSQIAPSPLPPVRSASFAVLAPGATAPPETTASILLPIRAPERGAAGTASADFATWGGDIKLLPNVITEGVRPQPATSALALVETTPAPVADNGALLARAAELEAPLPPAPVPNVGAPAASGAINAKTDRNVGFAAKVARLLHSLPLSLFRAPAAADPGDLRAQSQ